MQFVFDNWQAIVGLIFALLTYLFGKKRGAAKATAQDLRKTPTQSGAASVDLLIVVVLLAGVFMFGCTRRTWADNVRRTITVAFFGAKAAVERGMPQYAKKCSAIAEACGKQGDTNCQELKDCHQFGDSILTAYSAANAAMAMAMMTVAAVETIEREIERANGKELLTLEAERDQLTVVAQKQLKNAQKQAKRVIEELQGAGAI